MKQLHHRTILRTFLLTLFVSTIGLLLSASARAGLASVGGQAMLTSAPPSVVSSPFPFNLIYIFPERTSIEVTNPVAMNITQPGTYTNQNQVMAATTNIFLSGPVDSYYLHHVGTALNTTASATFGFNTDVLGIVALSTNLSLTHLQFGAPGTVYSTSPVQGYEFGADRVTISANRRLVTITTSAATNTLDGLRIITASSFLAPIANAGVDQSVNQFDFVSLNGSASSDPNLPALPLTYSWTQLSGIPVTLTGANTATPTFTAPIAPDAGAVLVFQLTVSNGAVSRSDTVAVNINFVNAPPTANAGTNRIVAENSIVALDGTLSSDPDNDPLTFQWSQVSGPIAGLTNANATHAIFFTPSISAAQGSVQYQFQLVVNDGHVSSAPSLVTITAINVNDPPLAVAGPNQTVNELTQVTLNGSDSRDPDGNALTYAWTQILGPTVTLSDTSAIQPTFTAPQVTGTNFVTLTFRLTVSDGLVSSSGTVNVRVNNVNHAPIADAGPDQTVPEGTTVTLDGTGSSDVDGDPITFAWFRLSGLNVTLSDSHSTTPTFVAPEVEQSGGSVTLVLIVTDDSGRVGTNTVVVSVTDANHAPTVNAGSDQTVNEGDLVTLSGSASDADGNTLAFNWTQVSGPVVSIENPASLSPSFTAPSVTRDEADVVLRLTADDGFGGVTNDDVSVHIANINHAPVAQPPANMTVPEGTDVTLVGQATDPDTEEQNQLVYVWTQTAGPAVTLSGTGPTVGFTSPLVTQGGDPDARETLTFALVVTDPNGASNTNGVDVVVANVDHSPIAVAGNNMTVDEGSSVSLNGSATSDPDADPLTFSWTQVSGPAMTLQDANTAFPQFTSPFVNTAGATLQFRLTVDDGFGGTNSATVTVTVNNINDAPNISQAQPSITSLWPPNHSMIEVSIVGIIDPNNNATINITSVTQDEPTNGEADATINSNGTALLRADRDGGGNGRVYHVHFTASDFEGSRSGVVKVIVPKSKKSDGAIDGGELYDSTQ